MYREREICVCIYIYICTTTNTNNDNNHNTNDNNDTYIYIYIYIEREIWYVHIVMSALAWHNGEEAAWVCVTTVHIRCERVYIPPRRTHDFAPIVRVSQLSKLQACPSASLPAYLSSVRPSALLRCCALSYEPPPHTHACLRRKSVRPLKLSKNT